MTSEPVTPGHPNNCSCGECEFRRSKPASTEAGGSGQHGIDFGGGFLAVFCERENLLAMYPHVCPDAEARADAGRQAPEETP